MPEVENRKIFSAQVVFHVPAWRSLVERGRFEICWPICGLPGSNPGAGVQNFLYNLSKEILMPNSRTGNYQGGSTDNNFQNSRSGSNDGSFEEDSS